MAVGYNSSIVTNGLIFALDAANTKSYSGSGTTWTDISRSNANGTLTNGPTFDTSFGGSIVFDGTNDYVSMPAGSNLLTFGTNDFTVSFWVYLSSTANQVIFTNYNAYNSGYSSYFYIGHWNSLNGIFILGSDGNVTNPTQVGSSISQNTWTHFTFTRTGTTYNCYKNGVFINSQSDSDVNFSGSGRPILLGGGLPDWGYMNGKIASLQIYNRYLTAAEIKQNYRANSSRFLTTSSFSPSNITGLQLWLDANDTGTLFQNSNGTTAVAANNDPVGYWGDKSGNSYNIIQSTAGTRPVFSTSSINGKNTVYFDGTKYMTNASIGGSQPYTIFMVFKLLNSNNHIWSSLNESGGLTLYVTNATLYDYTNGSSFGTNTTFTTFKSLTQVINGSSSALYVNGDLNNSGSLSTGRFNTGIVMGARATLNFPSQMYLAEFIIYNASLSTSQRRSVENYLNLKWGVY